MVSRVFLLFALAGCGDAQRDSESPQGSCPVFHDGDGDGFGDTEDALDACSAVPTGYVAEGGDCDDTDGSVFPGADERCGGGDENCDGVVDEAGAVDAPTWFADGDDDGHGAAAVVAVACVAPDGFVASGDDCDDADDQVLPGGIETCDGQDDDCDGAVDETGATGGTTYFTDADGDGFGDSGAPVEACDLVEGLVANDDDCDDTAASVHPDASETCNSVDDDCDDLIDEGDAEDAPIWYGDADGDGHGNAELPERACVAPSRYVAIGDDCDDLDDTVFPGADERCGGSDEDCDGEVDEGTAVDAPSWFADVDGDGYGDAASTSDACDLPSGFAATGDDCDDRDADISPGADERCDGVDDDCDGDIDEADASDALAWYPDADGDGFGDAAGAALACSAPLGFGADAGDCDDSAATISPAATEDCATADDDDCSGTANDGCWPVGEITTADADFALLGSAAREGFGRQVQGGADVTGDGVDDLLVAAEDFSLLAGKIWVVPGPLTSSTSSGSTAMEALCCGYVATGSISTGGDLDGDGVHDVVTRDYQTGLVSVFTGRTSGWSATADYSQDFDATYDSVNAADLDGDGAAELITNDGIDTVAVVFDVFGTPDTVTLDNTTATTYLGMHTLAVDLDGDGIDGLVFGAYYDNELWVFDDVPTASTTVASADRTFTGPASLGGALAALDADGDGHQDLVAGADQDSPVVLYLLPGPLSGLASGTIASQASLTITAPIYSGTGAFGADLDLDGQDDLAFGEHAGTQSWVILGPLPASGSLDVDTGSDYDLAISHATTASDSGFLTPIGNFVDGWSSGLALGVMGDSTAATNAGGVFLFLPNG